MTAIHSYTGLWTAYATTDKQPGTNYIWDIYSNYNFTYSTNQCGNYKKEGDCYNREHLWAQSWTNNDATEKTDLHHVYPTDGWVNSIRSNYAFGEVSTPTTTTGNGSKLGPNTVSGYSGTVFEPVDEYKGDIARALMYVSVRYYSLDGSWGTSDMTNKSVIKDWAIAMLLDWHENDPVSQKEIDRNNAVYNIQGNRNPFVDHPEFAERIWSTGTTYQITANVSPANSGTVSGAGTYGAGQTCTLTATPNSGYAFVNWTQGGDEVSTEASFSFTVTAAATYQANFVSNAYPTLALTANPAAGGTVLFEKTASIDFSEQSLTSGQSLNGENFEVDNNVSIGLYKNDGSNPPAYYTTGTAVRFYPKNTFVVNTDAGNIISVALTYGTGDNSNTISSNVGSFNGTTWTGEAESVTFTIGGTKDHRRIKTITVTYSAAQSSFDTNDAVTIKATSNSGYSFINWTKNDQVVSTNPTCNVTVTANANYVANFMNNNVTANTIVPSLTLAENATVTISAGATLKVTETITKSSGATIVVNDGCQLVNATSGITGKVTKDITAWSDTYKTGWQAISTPVNNVTFANVTNLTNTTYNVYRLNETTMIWENNQDSSNPFSSFENGRGYLYRKANSTAIEFNGTFNVSDVTYPLTYTSASTKGFHLIGNPYPHEIYKGDGAAIPNTYLEEGFYILTSAGAWQAGTDNATAIAPCQAVLVQAKNTVEIGDELTISKTTAAGTTKANDNIIMFVASNANYEDVAYAVFKKGHGLNKIKHKNEEIQMLSIEQNDEDFAIADIDENVRAFNLNFHTAQLGTYTMNVETTGDFSYLHLIDKMTGDDVDLLVDNEYTFIGTPQDFYSRFVVRLELNGNSDDANSFFAYQNGADIIVTGEGLLQIIDVMGRVVATHLVSDVETIRKPSSGVYVLRLIGQETKTQKIVVK